MNRKLFLIITLVFLLSCISIWTPGVQRVNASGTVYIRTDGSIYPPGSPIFSADEVTYFFTGDINGSLVVERSNITVEGAGKTVQGNGSGIGVTLTGRTNVTIEGLKVKGFNYGIWLNASSNCAVMNNNITNTKYSISLAASSSINKIIGNEIRYNEHGIGLDNCSNCIVKGNRIGNNGDGISVLFLADNNEIRENEIVNSYSWAGIQIVYSSGNRVHGNNITASGNYGIFLDSCTDNKVTENNIRNNEYGIAILASSNNVIFHNNFIDNRHHSLISSSAFNMWNDSYLSGGNYWSNFTNVDADHDGIGSSQYFMDANNLDQLPLMGTFSAFDATPGYTFNVVSNSTIRDFAYFENNGTVRMNVSNMSSTQAFGFCRVCIPRSLMSGPYSVIIDGGSTPVLSFNDILADNGTHRWIYFAYEHTEHRVEIVPELPRASALLLFATMTVLAAAIRKRKESFMKTQS